MSINCRFLFLLPLFLLLTLQGNSQVSKEDTTADTKDLESLLDKPMSPGAHPRYTLATFKSTRIVNGHSVENTGKGALDFRISHRFGNLNQGSKNFYGIDNAVTRLGLDYGIANWLMVGLGRGTYEKEYDAFFKVKLFRQTEDNRTPVGISYVGGISSRTISPVEVAGVTDDYGNRLCYISQLLVARKICKWLSLQLTPTYIHYNIVPALTDPNDILAMGVGTRLKISNRMALTGEYYYTLPGYRLGGSKNAVSVGLDIETGGHVFQLFFTYSAYITERAFIAETNGDIAKGDLHFGFNISRIFTVVKPEEFSK